MKWLIRHWSKNRVETIRQPTKRVAIMIPMPSPNLTADETISINHLRQHLDDYEKILLVPKGMRVQLTGFSVLELDRCHFGSAANHNRMLYLPNFWENFSDYEYVLMYHLDALVLSNQLEYWCARNLDFIGAPFIRCADAPWVETERVGNGGFALYRVSSVLKVLWTRYRDDPSKFYQDHCSRFIEFQRALLRPIRAAAPHWLRGRATLSLRSQLKKMDHLEVSERGNDLFWSDNAKHYAPDFKVGSLEEGLAFAFEVEPRRCLERTGGRIPFGCHAWGRYDRVFWENYLLNYPS